MKNQHGAGLIEVLVTVLILGTSLLSLAALQSKSLQYNHSAYLRSQANILAYDILDRVRINRTNTTSYSLGVADAKPTGTTLAEQDMNQWLTNIETMLPGADGGIECVAAASFCTVTIEWTEQNSSGQASEDESQFVYTTRL
ncbi:type IV pilus modification protein PilV [Microbulbifer hydrolyticus]|uniref:Type IV pilus assembly protein PilV n=1 Tax=Microbulbifer hydrolyticus TaxID=48074 RepID=A0A6P1T885_9GAMM|nr:type IV pilus modification protein PilV [Microbulbifer hydrolyticus]MBB5210915.1 type IV pilus assembly protein PilV [Microbulbifer hydrolyticus]QHQ38267.1 type IV pilus modification protein PilV [Microbulbifer hydrolyticus]